MKKKLVALLLALSMALSLAACGGNGNGGNSQNGGQEQGDAGNGGQVPDDGAQVPDGGDEPSQEGEDPEEAGKPALSEIFEGLKTVHADVESLSPVEGEILDSWYPGLASAEGVEEVMVMEPEISFSAMAVALVRLSEDASADQIQAVEDILQARLDSQASGGAYYLAAQEAWGEGVVTAFENYVGMFVCSGEARALANYFLTCCGGEALPDIPQSSGESGEDEDQEPNLSGTPSIPLPGANPGTENGDNGEQSEGDTPTIGTGPSFPIPSVGGEGGGEEDGGQREEEQTAPATPTMPSFPVPGTTGSN